jgi:putative oxidoreductase
MFQKLINTTPTWVTLPLRLALGAVFFAHGAQKVLGSFGGLGWNKWVAVPAPFSFMRPAVLWMGAAALSELIGGVLVTLGLLTRVGAFFIACTMFTVIASQWPNFLSPKGIGFEYPVALLAMCLALLITGGGQLSVDLGLTGSGGGRRR